MRSAGRLLAALVLVSGLGACTGAVGTSPAASAAPASAAVSVGPATPSPAETPRPSSAVTPASPGPASTSVGTTQTSWGRILDAVPAGFPVFPGATPADAGPAGPASGAWVTAAPVSEVAPWYRDALLAAHYAKVDLGSPLEDGSRVLDVQGDLPECTAQLTVAPLGASTMVTVLYGAGCVGGGDG